MTLTAVSLFAGIGGFDLALERAGVNVVAACEIDPDARAVLARHFPRTKLFTDVRELTADDLESAGFVPGRGIITAGFPCQDLSIAGRRAGLGGARSGLFWHIMRLADELSPRWLILENVAGLLSAVCSCPGDEACLANGRAVQCGRWETVSGERIFTPHAAHTPDGGACADGCMPAHGGAMGTVLGALGKRGYGFAYRVLDSRFFNVAQRRERVFIVGCAGDWTAPAEVLLEPESGTRHPAARGEARQDIAGTLGSRAGGSRTTDLDGHGAYVPVAPTITAGWGTNHGAPGHGGKDQAALAVVAATLQGGGRRGHRIDAEGAAGGHLVATQLAHSLTAREGKGADSDAVSGFVMTSCVTGSVTHALTSEGADASEDGTGRGTPIIAAALTAGSASGEGVSRPGRRQEDDVNLVASAFNWQTGGDGRLGYGDRPTALQASQITAVQTSAAVRRLTPRECERLQAFPDDWTRWKSAVGRVVEQSDSARYRQLGNAVTVSVPEWITRRVVALDAASQRTAGAA